MPATPIYLDNNSTTAVDTLVVDEMLPTFSTHYGNPSSDVHAFGWYAAELVAIARERVGSLLDARPEEIVFTSGATESNNLALKGAVDALLARGAAPVRIVTATTEHRAVLDPLVTLKQSGRADVTFIEVDGEGRLDEPSYKEAVSRSPALVSLMLANNEIGTVHPIARYAAAARAAGAIFHCDATQALGKIPVRVDELGVDLLSLSAHKMHGPKGAGALYVRGVPPAFPLVGLNDGGGQERGLRSGTLNVPGIVGLGKAAQIALAELGAAQSKLDALTRRFIDSLSATGTDFVINGPAAGRLPGNLNLSFEGLENASLVAELQGKVAFSVSSACHSTSKTPSHVLRALRIPESRQRSAVRLGFSRMSTEEEAVRAAELFAQAVKKLR